MKFIKVLLEKLSKVSASTAIKSAASGIAEHIDSGNSNKEEIYQLIDENLLKYGADKNVSNFLKSIDNFKNSSNLKISESLDKISKAKIDGDLKFVVSDLKEKLESNPEYSIVNETLTKLRPFRWSAVVKESLGEIECATKENSILSMLNGVIDQLLEDEPTNANAIQTLTQAYHLPETDIRHYLLAEFNGKAGIYPVVDEFIDKLVAMGDNLDVETIRYNIDKQGRYSASTPMSPVVQEGNRKFFMIRNRIFESWNGKVKIMESAKRIPAEFLALCNAFTKVKLNESQPKKKSFIFESFGNQMQISEDVGGEGYQIQLNKDQLGGDMTTYESEIENFGAQAEIPPQDIKDFLCLMGNFQSIGTLDNVISVQINDNVGLDIIKADGGMFISIYDKSADTMQLADIKDDEALEQIDNEYGVDVHEFLNEDDEEIADDGTVEPAGAESMGGGAEFTDDANKDSELLASLKELQDQFDETVENLDKLDTLEDEYKDDAVTELIEKLKNTKEQLEAEIKEIQILLGNENVTNEVAAKAMVDLETIISQPIGADEIEDSVFKNCETTNIDDKYSLTPIVEFIKDDEDTVKIGGIFIRIDSLDENVDILPVLQEKFDNLVDDNMIPILDEVVDVDFEQLSTLQAKIDTIVNKLESTDTSEPKPEGDGNEEPPVDDPNESKVNESSDNKNEVNFPSDFPNKILAGRCGYIEKTVDGKAYINFHDNSDDENMWIPVPVESLPKTNECDDKPNEQSIRNFKKNEAIDGTLVKKPIASNPENQVAISQKFNELIDYLKKNYKDGRDFSMNIDGDYIIQADVLANDINLQGLVDSVKSDIVDESNKNFHLIQGLLDISNDMNDFYNGIIAGYDSSGSESIKNELSNYCNDNNLEDITKFKWNSNDFLNLLKIIYDNLKNTSESSNESGIIATKVEIDGTGFSVLIEDKDNNFSGYMDIYIKDNDVIAEWNKYIFNNTNSKDKSDKRYQDSNFEECSSVAISYLEDKGLVNQDDDGNWSRIDESKGNNEKIIGKIEILLKQNNVDEDTTNEIIFALKNSETPNIAEILNGALRKTLADKIWNEIKNVDESINENQLKPLFVFSTANDAWTIFSVQFPESGDAQAICDAVSISVDEEPGTYKVYDTKEFDGFKFLWCEDAGKDDINIIVVPATDTQANQSTFDQIKSIIEKNAESLSTGTYFNDEALSAPFIGTLSESSEPDNLIKKTDLVKLWDEIYGENFVTQYRGLYRKLKDTFTLDELIKAWNEMYGEDFKTEYEGLYNKFTVASKYPEFREFVKELYTKYKLAFHPDDSFADYVKIGTDEPLFTPEEAQAMQDKWDSLVKNMSDDDMYDVIYDVRRELSLDDLSGGQQ